VQGIRKAPSLAFFFTHCPKNDFFPCEINDKIFNLTGYIISHVLHLSFCGKIGQNVEFGIGNAEAPIGCWSWTKQK